MDDNLDQEIKKHSFGRYLWSARQDRDISITQLCNETKIAQDIIRLIEEENHALLPEKVFVTGFIRSYTKALGLDGDEVVRLYYLSYENYRSGHVTSNEKMRKRVGTGVKFAIAICLFCLIIAVSFFLMENNGKPVHDDNKEFETEIQQGVAPPVKDEVKTDSTKVEETNAKESVEETKAEDKAEAPAAVDVPSERVTVVESKIVTSSDAASKRVIKKKMKLKVICIEDTWMKIIVDGQDPVEFTMKPKSEQLLEAYTNFNILVGNAGGVKMMLDGKPVKVPGKSGQIATIQIP